MTPLPETTCENDASAFRPEAASGKHTALSGRGRVFNIDSSGRCGPRRRAESLALVVLLLDWRWRSQPQASSKVAELLSRNTTFVPRRERQPSAWPLVLLQVPAIPELGSTWRACEPSLIAVDFFVSKQSLTMQARSLLPRTGWGNPSACKIHPVPMTGRRPGAATAQLGRPFCLFYAPQHPGKSHETRIQSSGSRVCRHAQENISSNSPPRSRGRN